MRFHEFYRIVDGRVAEMQALWDIPEVMMQARAWPMAPQLGAFLCTPAPMSGDGLTASGDGQAAQAHVRAMLELQRRGAVTFDYGNNLRGQALEAGVAEAIQQPGALHYLGQVIYAQGITRAFQDGFMILAVSFTGAALAALLLTRKPGR